MLCSLACCYEILVLTVFLRKQVLMGQPTRLVDLLER